MDPTIFGNYPTGRLVKTVLERNAFVPNRLPPEIPWPQIAQRLGTTMQAIGELNAAGRSLQNPSMVIRPLQRREALLTSKMEGTYTTANALVLAEADPDRRTDSSTIEVRNYIRAFEHMNNQRAKLPISGRMIREGHRILMEGVSSGRGANNRPGEYKSEQNFIGGGDRKIENARFIPPPPKEAVEAMAHLEAYINRAESDDIPPIIDAALVYYQFECIHPFGDGNGRIGRALIPLFLMESGTLDQPLLYVSPAVEGRKADYVDLLLDVSRKGNWAGWINFSLEMVEQSCRSVLATIDKMESMRAHFRSQLAQARASVRAIDLVDDLFALPVVSIPDVQNRFSITYPAAKNLVERLAGLDILAPIDTTSNPKRWICWQAVDLSENG